MAKIKLDLDPQGPITFDREVSIPTPSGKVLKVAFTFLHRTREQLAELSDQMVMAARERYEQSQREAEIEAVREAQAKADKVPYLPQFKPAVDQVEQGLREDVEAVMRAATGWNLDYEFTAENLTKFFRLYLGAAAAITAEYNVSMTKGRLGN